MDRSGDIRRLENGSIDFDFYRREARALRTIAIGEAFRGNRPGLDLAIVAGLAFIALAIFVAPAHVVNGWLPGADGKISGCANFLPIALAASRDAAPGE